MKQTSFICEVIATGRITREDARDIMPELPDAAWYAVMLTVASGERLVNLALTPCGVVSWAVAPFTTGERAWTVRVPCRTYSMGRLEVNYA